MLANRQGLTVVSTRRSPAGAGRLLGMRVDHVIIDDGAVAPKLRGILPAATDPARELLGARKLRHTLRALKVQGVAWFTGMLSNSWCREVYRVGYLPCGVWVTAYSGEAADLPAVAVADYRAAAAADPGLIPLDRVFGVDRSAQVDDYLERVGATGQIVVLS